MDNVMVKLTSIIKFCIVGYVVFGFGVSAVPIIKKMAFIFTIMGVFFLVYYIVRERMVFPLYIRWLGVFFLYLSISILWAPVFDLLAIRSLLTIFLASSLVVLALHFRIISIEWLIVVLAIPAIINMVSYVLGINYYFIGHDGVDTTEELAMDRFGGLTGHPNNLAIRCLLPMMLLGFFYKEIITSRRSVIIVLLSVICAIFAIYVTGSKKSVALLLLSLCLIGISTKSGKFIIPFSTILVACFGTFISIYLIDTLLNFDVNAISRLGEMLDGSDSSTLERKYMAVVAPIIFLEFPVFGAGFNGFAHLSGIGAYAHNNHLELAASSGMIGIVLYYSIFIAALLSVVKRKGFVFSIYVLAVFLFMEFTAVVYMERAAALFLFIYMFFSFAKSKLVS